MKPYIDFNTEKRKACKDEFGKDLYKLLNNIIYGRSLMNIRNRLKVILNVNNRKRFEKFVAKPDFVRAHTYGNPEDNFQALVRKQRLATMTTPVYLGFAILGKKS